ncbi:cation:proton antiporter regulatory subunit [Streptomyces sp. JJ36]|uniref:cation:proton antiporter regulatory subunit n=1 Tax=Streptomyces sp. JJ36 TaxID=2736645 RepID=UPI001F3189CD|nr:TrkA C-terminal domain-containing protein [Streptomyces sp. JJ36]MCF6523858.1 cation:proton antiporter regulatory subunit [Streptomyces sp. JJ36]
MITRRTSLPGLGVQYDIETRHGDRHVSVVVHQDGRRFVGFYEAEDPDACQATVPLDPDESAALAELLTPEKTAHWAAYDFELDLVTERLPVAPGSRYSGRPLGDTRARTRTGASIVAVLRRTGAHPAPGPDFRLEGNDELVVVGTREGVDDLALILSES